MQEVTHVLDTTIIDDTTPFGEYKKTPKYRYDLESVERSVRGGQHLRFIGNIYRSPKVCLTAIENHIGGYMPSSSIPQTSANSGVCACCLAGTPVQYRSMPELKKYFDES